MRIRTTDAGADIEAGVCVFRNEVVIAGESYLACNGRKWVNSLKTLDVVALISKATSSEVIRSVAIWGFRRQRAAGGSGANTTY